MGFAPTSEQQAIIDQRNLGQSFKVEAVAGSGKTATVQLMAESCPDLVCLYLAFNKVAAVEAEGKMPPNTHCCTTHSKAYAAFGADYRHKLSRPRGGYVNVAGTVKEIVRYYGIKDFPNVNAAYMAMLAKKAVASYESSGALTLTRQHINTYELRKKELTCKSLGREFNFNHIMAVVEDLAKAIWKDRVDIDSPVLITHDTYLKLWQLSEPDLSAYDVIFLDEAQDTSDCVIDIVNRQKGQIIVVGDSYQAIYAWRGAVNALGKIATASLPLSQSFRYGPDVATIARYILNDAMVVKGWEELDTKVGMVDKDKPYTKLFRTNMAIIREGVSLLRNGQQVEIVADIAGFNRKLDSIDHLRFGNLTKVKHEDIVIFKSWRELEEEAEASGGEIKLLRKLVLQDNYRQIRTALKNYTKPVNPDIVLTTAHKSKGMEYEQVILADDFPDVFDSKTGEYSELDDMERNLLYVAATRATKVLQVNQTVLSIIGQRNSDGMRL